MTSLSTAPPGSRGGSAPDHPPPRTWRKLLLTGHIVAAVALIGADLTLLTLGIASVRGADPQTVYPAASLVASSVIAPLVIVTLVTGIIQAIASRWGLLQYWWVTIKLTTTVVFTGIVWFLLVPRLAESGDAATAPEPFTVAERLPLAVVPAMATTLLVLLTGLAVHKPRWRLRSPN